MFVSTRTPHQSLRPSYKGIPNEPPNLHPPPSGRPRKLQFTRRRCPWERISQVFFLLVLAAVPDSLSAQDRAHQLAQQASKQKAATCPKPNNLTLQQCHDKFPDGCSASPHPSYDAYLDFLKDQDPDPGLAPTKKLADADFKRLKSQLTQLSQSSKARRKAKANAKARSKTKKGGLTATNHASFAPQFAVLGEGNLYTVIAYLYFAEDTGNPPPGKSPNVETCNCKLTASDTFDYHIGIGFDSGLASQAAATHPKSGDALYS